MLIEPARQVSPPIELIMRPARRLCIWDSGGGNCRAQPGEAAAPLARRCAGPLRPVLHRKLRLWLAAPLAQLRRPERGKELCRIPITIETAGHLEGGDVVLAHHWRCASVSPFTTRTRCSEA